MKTTIKRRLPLTSALCAILLASCTTNSNNDVANASDPITRFNTPAYVNDVEHLPEPEQEAFFNAWSDYINSWTENAIHVGLAPAFTNSLPGDYYFNPMRKGYGTKPVVVPVRWNASPYRMRFYYEAQLDSMYGQQKIVINGKKYQKSDYEFWKLVDMGADAYSAQNDSFNQDVLPGSVCNSANDKFGKEEFTPLGPRGWLDEYCEFAVKRDGRSNEIEWAMFTCENPEYYWTLWTISPETVLKIYQETLDNPKIQLEDLMLKDAKGNPVILPNGKKAYNPINKYNSGTVIGENSGGAIHLTSPPNELQAEIILAAGACIPRESDNLDLDISNDLICCSQYGRRFRNSDPHIGQSVYQAISKQPLAGTLINPVGLYLQLPNFDLFELPDSIVRKGGKPEDCWKVLRGEVSNPNVPNNMILRAKFEVPKSWGIKTSDIKIAGSPLLYASQISQVMEVQLTAAAVSMPEIAPKQVCVESRELPMIQYVLYQNLYEASVANGLDTASNFSCNPIALTAGSSTDDVLIITTGFKEAGKNVTFEFIDTMTGKESDIKFEVTSHKNVPQKEGAAIQYYVGKVTAGDVPSGIQSIRIKSDKDNETFLTPGYFRIYAKY